MRKFIIPAFLVVLIGLTSYATEWRLIGPDGGDARSLAYDPANPSHILLGTSAGQLFASNDGGDSWAPFAHLGPGDDYVLDHVIFDPAHPATIYVAGWSIYREAGDVFRSDDGGRTWRTLNGVHGKSVRTMAMAPSDHNVLVIGALDGVFRSNDGGKNWERISPEGHADIKNIESLAIDPRDPGIIYAGTFHLPWKTEDDGGSWHSIITGWAPDSDVFSIIVDPQSPQTVYASACSGIYKSMDAGGHFSRVEGIPHSAIRTRVIKQDPQRPEIVYAGTTGGLWKSLDAGHKWELTSKADLVVNDILIDPRDPDRVLLATDRAGVLASNDRFDHYIVSNRGFSHRVVGSVISDRDDPNRLYVGVVNDKELGGFFVSDDNGGTWWQWNKGLDGRDILSLQQTEDGAIFAGTNHNLFRLASLGGNWEPASMYRGVVPEGAKPASQWQWEPLPAGHSSVHKGHAQPSRTRRTAPLEHSIPPATGPRVRALAFTQNAWYAATNEGLFTSVDHGRSWYGGPILGESDLLKVSTAPEGKLLVASGPHAFVSNDEGKTWIELVPPQYVASIYSLNQVPDGTLWMGSREGALRSSDNGKTWEHVIRGIPGREVLEVRYDVAADLLLATALNEHCVFESKDGGRTWRSLGNAAVSIRAAIDHRGRLLAASSYNGLLLEQPDAAPEPESARAAGAAKTVAPQ